LGRWSRETRKNSGGILSWGKRKNTARLSEWVSECIYPCMSINGSCNGSFFTANLQCTLHWTTSWRPSSLPSFFTGERGREWGLLSFFLLMLEEIYLLKCGAVCLFAASSQIQMGYLFFWVHRESISLQMRL
jgi:hypothetical protein